MQTAANPQQAQTPSSRGVGIRGPERRVLGHLLDQHPRRLTLADLAREVGSGLEGREIERAVNNLAAADFLRHDGPELAPAPSVVSFDREPVGAN